MDIDYIHEFVVLADTGNYMEAADKLFLTQSSLTRHIQKLEADLGVLLFDRSTRHIELNKYGNLFMPYARQISQLQKEYTTTFCNELNRERGTIRIGAIPVMAQYQITDILARFQQENRNFMLDIQEADSLKLIQMLRDEEIDFAVIRESDDASSAFCKIPITQDTLAALMPAGHPLAVKDHIELKQLYRDSFLLLGRDTFMYSLCVRECRSAGFEHHRPGQQGQGRGPSHQTARHVRQPFGDCSGGHPACHYHHHQPGLPARQKADRSPAAAG